MSQSLESGHLFLEQWKERVDPRVEVAVFPSYPHLSEIKSKASGFKVGAQDCSTEAQGAFTGEVSALMIAELKLDYCLVGHSERRQRLGETKESLVAKLKQLETQKVTPVLCVGESQHQREAGQVEAVLSEQLSVLDGLSSHVILAYEPVWAIGTGLTADQAQVEEAHRFIKKKLPEDLPVLYGGSVKPENASEILSYEAVDGLLIGGASLEAQSLSAIYRSALEGL